MKRRTESGEMTNLDIIRQIMRDHSSRENLLGITAISRYAKDMGYSIGRNAIEGFMTKMNVMPYETEEECDELLQNCFAEMREIYFCKTSPKGRRTRGYWMKEPLSDSEWMYLIDSILYSKILTKKESDNFAKRVTFLAGKNLSELTKYRHRMDKQPYIVGDEDINEKVGHIESRVLKYVRMIRDAIKRRKRVKFNLCVYEYRDMKIRLTPYGKQGLVLTEPEIPDKYKKNVHRVVSPLEVIYSNGRYYMLGADGKTEKNPDLKYKLYRVDLMDDLTINLKDREATTKEDAGIQDELENLYKYRMENPYMFTGKVENVRIRVDADQFTQIVDWFSDDFEVIGSIHKESDTFDTGNVAAYDIDVKVNLNSFTFWVLQYSGCVEVIERKGNNSYRKHIKDTLKKAWERYED